MNVSAVDLYCMHCSFFIVD